MNVELRSYKKIGMLLKARLAEGNYQIGDKLPPERELAEEFGVSRTVIREALIMLELDNLVSIKKGSGVYIVNLPIAANDEKNNIELDIGPFELLQARQLLESSIAEFAAIQATKKDVERLKNILNQERETLAKGGDDYVADEDFHCAIAEITQNEVLIKIQQDLWEYRTNSDMWKGLHAHIPNQSYRFLWLNDHENIISAIQKKDPAQARKAMWQHLENVKQKLFELSDVEDPNFDGYLFNINPISVGI